MKVEVVCNLAFTQARITQLVHRRELCHACGYDAIWNWISLINHSLEAASVCWWILVFAASAHQQQAPRSAAILVNANFDEPQTSNCARRLYIMFWFLIVKGNLFVPLLHTGKPEHCTVANSLEHHTSFWFNLDCMYFQTLWIGDNPNSIYLYIFFILPFLFYFILFGFMMITTNERKSSSCSVEKQNVQRGLNFNVACIFKPVNRRFHLTTADLSFARLMMTRWPTMWEVKLASFSKVLKCLRGKRVCIVFDS